MWQWVHEKWLSDWIGNIVWWQSVAGICQAVFGMALFLLTRKSVDLTEKLTKAQFVQIQLESLALKRELYEKRLRIFRATESLFAEFLSTRPLEEPMLRHYVREMRESEFLFDDDLTAHLLEILNKAGEYRRIQARPSPPDVDLTDEAGANEILLSEQQLSSIRDWMVGYANFEAKLQFKKYLNLRECEREIVGIQRP